MKSRSTHLLVTLTLTFALALGMGMALALSWSLGVGLSARAAPADELHVCPSGCTYSSVQAAVDAAEPGDVIKVTEGTYTDIHMRKGITQVVYISKSVTIRGGYATADWTTPDPDANTTTLDAQGQGRVLVITDTVNVTVEGLRITGGDATGQGGTSWADVGGGVYVHSYWSMATISNCVVIGNTATRTSGGAGGGLYLGGASAATLIGNKIIGNTASEGDWGNGGGLYVSSGSGILNGNTVQGNRASTASTGVGGGLYLIHSGAALSGNAIISNTASTAADGYGGGLYSYDSGATLSGNTFQGNTASTVSAGDGGGLHLDEFSDATLTNNVVADNWAGTTGGGLYIRDASPRLIHTTVARNTGGDGSGVYITSRYGSSTVAMTNTILSGHTVGVTVTTGNTATLNATLWHGNARNTGGAGTVLTGAVNVHDDPAFAPDGHHLAASSAAIDAGVDAGVKTDVDGDIRPWGAGYDIGADELRLWYVYLPLVLNR